MPNNYKILSNNVLIAPLNWGLGHATRCIPIIRALLDLGFNPIIASDGMALLLLQKEFPTLICVELPSYKIEYSTKATNFKLKMLQNSPNILRAMLAEKRIVADLIAGYKLKGIISDSRLGVYSKNVPSVFITHQLNVLSGNTSWLTGKLQRFFIKKFNQCWVPDAKGEVNLSGKLGHLRDWSFPIKYLGPLSRMSKMEISQKYSLMVLLSGPEPQRTLLEEILIQKLKCYRGKMIFVKGIVEDKIKVEQIGNCSYYNFLTSEELEIKINESQMIVCRSGYTTIIDLCKLRKKALLIPTPGQDEQEYLAKMLFKKGYLPFVKQDNFSISDLDRVEKFAGLPEISEEIDWESLFSLFECK